VESAAKRRGIPLGSVSVSWEAAKSLLDKGYLVVSMLSDLRFMVQAGRSALESFAKATGRV
jgi:hypothetical protein